MIPTNQQEGRLAALDLDLIRPNPKQPRVTIDEAELQQLAASLAEHGVLQPPVVRVIPIGPGPEAQVGYELVTGSRRLAAAKRLGWKRISVQLLDLTDEQAADAALVENLERAALSPLDQARAVVEAIKGGASFQQLAKRFARTPGWVARRAKLIELPQAIWDAAAKVNAEEGHELVSIAHLELLALLPPEEQLAIEGELSVLTLDDLRAAVARHQHALDKAPWKLENETLLPAAGACATCTKRSDHQAELFDGLDLQVRDSWRHARLGEGPRCLDSSCWDAKLERWREQVVAEKKADVRISETWHQVPKGALKPDQYSSAKKGDPGAVKAVRVDGPKMGTTTYVTRKGKAAEKAAKEATPKPKGDKTPAPAETAADVRERIATAEARLQGKRLAFAIDQFLDLIEKSEEQGKRSLLTLAKDGSHAIAAGYWAARYYGTLGLEGGLLPEEVLVQAEERSKAPPEAQLLEMAVELWQECQDNLRSELGAARRNASLTNMANPAEEAHMVLTLLRGAGAWDALLQKASAEIPEPKSLARDRERLAELGKKKAAPADGSACTYGKSKPAAKPPAKKKAAKKATKKMTSAVKGPLTHAQASAEAKE